MHSKVAPESNDEHCTHACKVCSALRARGFRADRNRFDAAAARAPEHFPETRHVRHVRVARHPRVAGFERLLRALRTLRPALARSLVLIAALAVLAVGHLRES
jgi:hypothetical protein